MSIFKYLLVFFVLFSSNIIKPAESEIKVKQETFFDPKKILAGKNQLLKNAIDNNNLDELDKLLNEKRRLIKGGQLKFKNPDIDQYLDPLEYALQSNANLDIIKLFISKESYSNYGFSESMRYLASAPNIETFNYLLSEMKKINQKFNVNYNELLRFAIKKGNMWAINYALNNDENLTLEDKLGSIKNKEFFDYIVKMIPKGKINFQILQAILDSPGLFGFDERYPYIKAYALGEINKEKLKKIKETLIESGHFPRQSEIPTLIAEYAIE